MSEQRDLMRKLWTKHDGDEAEVVARYAAAEGRGEVPRGSNAHGMNAASYARALLRDGLRKDWLQPGLHEPGSMPMPRKRRAENPVPPFILEAGVEQDRYKRWLDGRAKAHAKRDKKRATKAGLNPVTAADYRKAIHQAVIRSDGVDEYTGDLLDWSLIGTYNNAASAAEGSAYKMRFRRMPSVDHVHGEDHRPHGVDDLRFCSWELNDAKADLSWEAFVALCRRVVQASSHRRGRK